MRGRACLFNLLVKYDGPGRSTRGTPGAQDADDGGKNRDDGNNGNHIVNVLADIGDEMPQRIPSEDHGANPENAAKNIEEQIARIRHLCCAGDRRTEGSHDGNETRENHSAAAVFFVEIVSALEMAAAEEKGVFA